LRLPLIIARAPADVDTTHLPNTTVLVVEDTDYNAWAATAVLAKLGLSCERAHTGAEALALFGEKRFNVVLLDRNLPDMDGTEVARRMREMESDGRQAVLLAVTAYCTAEDRAMCLESGMDAFVGKPLTPDKLRKVLLVAGRRMLAAAPLEVRAESRDAQIDLSLLNYLSDGSEEGLDRQVQRFLTALEAAYAELERAWIAHDFSGVAQEAHRVAGHARMVGATALDDAAARLSATLQGKAAAADGDLFRAVGVQFRAVMATVRRRRPVPLPR
jgi:CheY-like chemotaxis protein